MGRSSIEFQGLLAQMCFLSHRCSRCSIITFGNYLQSTTVIYPHIAWDVSTSWPSRATEGSRQVLHFILRLQHMSPIGDTSIRLALRPVSTSCVSLLYQHWIIDPGPQGRMLVEGGL